MRSTPRPELLTDELGTAGGGTVSSLVVLGHAAPLIAILLLLLAIAFAAGSLGALLGLGGGLILVPALVILFGIDVHLAIATSLVSVIATSSGAASSGAEVGYTNLRVAMFLETATSVGGLAGAVLAVTVLANQGNLLVAAFIPLVIGAAVYMFRQRGAVGSGTGAVDPIAVRYHLEGSSPDSDARGERFYRARRTRSGLALSGVAGVASGLLGIGGGLFYVPGMNALMQLPIRVASATSTFMIGVTAAASALVYLFAGDVALLLTAPAAVGTVLGSRIGSTLRPHAPTPWLRLAFVVVLVAAALSLIARLWGVFP